MKRLVCLMVVLSLSCGVALGADPQDSYYVSWTSWGDHVTWENGANWEWDGTYNTGLHATPVSWTPARIGNRITGTHNITTASNISLWAIDLGLATDPVGSVTLNIGSGTTFTTNSYKWFKAGSKATLNVSGAVTAGLTDINAADMVIDDGGSFKITSNYWYIRSGALVTVNDGGTLWLGNDTAYGSGGRSGSIDLMEGGVLKFTGDDQSTANTYITSNFVTANGGDTDDSLLEITYDGAYTYVTAVPEPATMVLLGLGSGVLALRRRR